MSNVVNINTARSPSLNVGTGIVTMTSLQIVDYVNTERQQVEDAGGKKFVELQHAHFMKKVPKVLLDEPASNFCGSYIGKDQTTRPCYVFPKREAALMAMSYSYKIQAQVWDHMTRLEDEMTKQTGSPMFIVPTTLAEALRLAADKTEEVERTLLIVHEQKAQIKQAAPKVEMSPKFLGYIKVAGPKGDTGCQRSWIKGGGVAHLYSANNCRLIRV